MNAGKWIVLGTIALSFLVSCGQSLKFTSNVLRSDTFVQLFDNDQYDFLWVFDNSASMADKRAYVKNNMNSFLNILESRKAIDYQMAVTTTDLFSDNGNLVQTPGGTDVILSSMANPVSEFASIVNNVSDSATSFWEQGLEAAYQAISNHGDDFLRTGVPMILIFLTDEEDYSCQQNCFGAEPENNSNWDAFTEGRYSDFFTNTKLVENTDTSVFPIVGTSDSSCTLPSTGDRYINVADEVGGLSISGSVCNEELPTTFENIARVIADRGVKFTLSDKASATGIQVFVDGTSVAFGDDNGFTFDEESNAIIFSGTAIPNNGQTIEVIYSEDLVSSEESEETTE